MKTLRYSILAIIILGLFGAGKLVYKEILTRQGCPKIMYIPMCFVVLICFIIPFIAQLLKKWNDLYFLFTGFAGIIALIASIMQFTENAECPKTNSGTPMCYYSLVVFSSLIFLKIYSLKISSQK
jgi:hypothetical protein